MNTETTIFVYDGAGRLVAEYSTRLSQTPDISFMTANHLNSTRIQTNALGQVISRHDYQPFGEEIQRANYGADEIRQKFTGYERDAETNLDYAQTWEKSRFEVLKEYRIIWKFQKSQNNAGRN